MNKSQAMLVLTVISMIDRRNVDEDQAQAWAQTLPDVTVEEAMTAVPEFFREPEKWLAKGERKWLMPDHLLKIVRDKRTRDREAKAAREESDIRRKGHSEPWRHCGNPDCRCTHTHCCDGLLDVQEEYQHNGFTYRRSLWCPQCHPEKTRRPPEQYQDDPRLL